MSTQSLISAPSVQSARPIAPAYYIGTQEGLPATATRKGIPSIDLYNLTADISGHNTGSTVSAQTLIDHGFALPTK